MFKATIILLALLSGPQPEPVGMFTLDPVYESAEACAAGAKQWVTENTPRIRAEAKQKKITVTGGVISCEPVEDRKV